MSQDRIPDGSVVITPAEMYREIRATGDAVRDLAGKLDTVPAKLEDHETRLRTIEGTRIPHVVIEVAAAVAGSAALIWQAFRH